MKRTGVKICGITQRDQALEISALGVDAMGFVLYPPSPRNIDVFQLRSFLQDLPPFLKTVGVFVNEPMFSLMEIVQSTGLDMVQLCGDESPEYCRTLTTQSVSWVKALRIKDKLDYSVLKEYPSNYILPVSYTHLRAHET